MSVVRSRRSRVAVILVVVVASVISGMAGYVAADANQQQDSGPGESIRQQIDTDAVVMRADVDSDGSASWSVSYRVRLDDENTTAAFESIQQDIQQNPENFTSTFGARMRDTASTAENATGREMSVRNVTVSAETTQLPQEYGVITYRFEWTGFAAAEGDAIRIGDALEGFFLDSETRLIVSWPEEYERQQVEPSPSKTGDAEVTWTGPLDFGSGEPRVVVSKATGPLGDLSLPLLVGVVVLVAVAGAGFLWWRRSAGAPEPVEDVVSSGSAAAEPADSDRTGSAETVDEQAQEQIQEPPDELLSNEERVMKLVRERGGRLKQQEIVETLDWTEAKTSQVVRELRDDGQLEGFRLGRENVLRLPEEDEGDGENNI